MEKYFNDAIIGNRFLTASYTSKGELIRLYYPNVDFKQFIDFFHVGLKINDSKVLYLHDDINNTYNQYYVEDTNILKTDIYNKYFNLKIEQTDFGALNENFLIKKYVLTNNNTIDLNIDFLVHSKILSDTNYEVSGYVKDDALYQYSRDYVFATFSKFPISDVQINNASQAMQNAEIGAKDYIGMSNESCINYKIYDIKPGESKEIVIFISIAEYEKINVLRVKHFNVKIEEKKAKNYWNEYIYKHNPFKTQLVSKNAEPIKKILTRSILLLPLLTNMNGGGISAAIEVDEHKTKCGKYAYCWPRDAVFITEGLDIIGLKMETEKFYREFCKEAQSSSGRWEQRFYTDGKLAPSWGYQIDETASVIYGLYNHYKKYESSKFLKTTTKMCEKAIENLKKYVEAILSGTPELPLSYDLWEENEGVHAYSMCAIYGAFDAYIKLSEDLKVVYEDNRLKLEQIRNQVDELQKYMRDIKGYVIKHFYDENRLSFVRSNDKKMDISLLGLVTPFRMFEPKERRILNTVERINLTLRTYTGGYLRYENDNYMGGNPWTVSNLWLANYYIEAGEKEKAKECFDFVVKTCSQHGLIPEQVNNSTLKPAWVLGLAWSHALFLIVLNKLIEENMYGKN
ncbi:MAG: hypothetical protein LBL91_01040 [Lachnospiraceae bacterium]|jgi:oligosaccharide amylase|nr:hypothetical protein [Lachnospiraceae bacterium]